VSSIWNPASTLLLHELARTGRTHENPLFMHFVVNIANLNSLACAHSCSPPVVLKSFSGCATSESAGRVLPLSQRKLISYTFMALFPTFSRFVKLKYYLTADIILCYCKFCTVCVCYADPSGRAV
jgi:hypothetical protein